MRTTTKMGLTSWDDADDDYDYQQLANNWQLVDFHDHTPGRGVPVAPGGLASGAVLQQNIAAGVIGSQHLSTALLNSLAVTPSPQSVSANVTATLNKWIIVPTSLSGAITITLPTPTAAGQFVWVTNLSSNYVVTVSSSASIYSPGTAVASSISLGPRALTAQIVWDGTGWVLQGLQDSGWLPLTPLNGFVAAATSTYGVPAVRVRGDMAQLRGVVQNPTGSTITNPIANLPSIAVPVFACLALSALMGTGPIDMFIDTAIHAVGVGAGQYVSLGSIPPYSLTT